MTITADPLCWPPGWKRTPQSRQRVGPFGELGYITIEKAGDRLRDELRQLGAQSNTIIVSTNLRLRNDGRPYSQQRMPKDPGVAVYWKDPYNGAPRCMAADQFTKVEQNIAALAATIKAMRAIERYGGATIIERAFTGFTALPAPIVAGMRKPWHQVLDVSPLCTLAEARAAYLRIRSKHHPDKNGGSHSDAFNEAVQAWEEAQKEIDHGE